MSKISQSNLSRMVSCDIFPKRDLFITSHLSKPVAMALAGGSIKVAPRCDTKTREVAHHCAPHLQVWKMNVKLKKTGAWICVGYVCYVSYCMVFLFGLFLNSYDLTWLQKHRKTSTPRMFCSLKWPHQIVCLCLFYDFFLTGEMTFLHCCHIGTMICSYILSDASLIHDYSHPTWGILFSWNHPGYFIGKHSQLPLAPIQVVPPEGACCQSRCDGMIFPGTCSSWWLNQSIWNIFVKLDNFPKIGMNMKHE